MCVFLSLLICPFLIFFFTCCLSRGWQGLKLNEAIFLFPQTCLPVKKFSSFLWLSEGSGISCRGSWNRCDSGQDYCEEEQKETVKKARNILFLLLISHTVCQNLILLNDHTQAPASSQEDSRSQPRLPGKWWISNGLTGSSQMWWVYAVTTVNMFIPWDNVNTVGYSHNQRMGGV